MKHKSCSFINANMNDAHQRRRAIRYAKDLVRNINQHLGYDAAHVARHNFSGELASVIVENGSVDVRQYPNLDNTTFTFPVPPKRLFFDAHSPNRLEIW